jgi:hypothetical protein
MSIERVRSQAGAACSIPIDGQFTRLGQAQEDVPGRRSDGSRVQDPSNLHSHGVSALGRAIKRVAVDVEANSSTFFAR